MPRSHETTDEMHRATRHAPHAPSLPRETSTELTGKAAKPPGDGPKFLRFAPSDDSGGKRSWLRSRQVWVGRGCKRDGSPHRARLHPETGKDVILSRTLGQCSHLQRQWQACQGSFVRAYFSIGHERQSARPGFFEVRTISGWVLSGAPPNNLSGARTG
jgi:hypothetical protein